MGKLFKARIWGNEFWLRDETRAEALETIDIMNKSMDETEFCPVDVNENDDLLEQGKLNFYLAALCEKQIYIEALDVTDRDDKLEVIHDCCYNGGYFELVEGDGHEVVEGESSVIIDHRLEGGNLTIH